MCAVRRGMVIEKLIVWRNTDTMRTVERIEEEAAKVGVRPYRPASDYLPDANGRIVVDVVGIGAGIVDRLRQLGYHVRAFNGGAFTTDQRKFLNVRAASYWHLRTLLEEGKIALPRDSGLFQELLSLRWFPTSDGKVQLERKQDLNNRSGRSPDKADACVMAWGKTGNEWSIGTLRF